MGVLAPSTNMPSSKFIKPKNLDAIKAHTTFQIKMAIRHLDAGHFTNSDTTFFGAPQQLNSGNDIIGHTHFVIEKLSSVSSTDLSDPSQFVSFIGVDTAADREGNVSANVTNGLPVGTYKLSSINSSANHAPVLVAVAQHGTLDDQIYVRVSLYTATYLDSTFLGLQFFVTSNGKRPKKFV
jgi:predicted PolB exonuclease-like 3'-5' exonuclease